MDEKNIKEYVKERYGQIANNQGTCSCCGGDETTDQALQVGYTAEELAQLPEDAVLGLGCGNPTALAGLKEGEVVLDLGSGAGIDVFLASAKVGKTGKAIGLDMTEEMVKKANKNAEERGYPNVEFHLGEIENMPLADESVDVIISNCVINLTTDKLISFEEAHRVLKPGGRIMISDLVTEGELDPEIKKSFTAWSECVAGALEKEEYLDIMVAAGFNRLKIVSETEYQEPNLNAKLKGKIKSIQVKAIKGDCSGPETGCCS
ncbi:MAG: arsenite methyltransferase [Methanobacteriaceae archaeon]|nr:arsenite methyltransferase [Methanobacteriaceae archaeon]